ncbi:MAG: tetratricopeptide repeat protein [Anaerolineae bacterium]|nr:tetratricopeptide repeat protein [Anaerolineae bacterium]
MSASQTAQAVQAVFETDRAVEDQAIRHWKSADRLAAGARLELARRYQNQYERLDYELANLRASQSWLAAQNSEETAHLVIAYVQVLASYLRQRGFNAELLQWCEDGLRACERLRQSPGWLLLLRSEAQMVLGRWHETMSSIQAAIEASEGDDPRTYARACASLGHLQFNQGDYRIALKTLTKAEKLLSEQADYKALIAVRLDIVTYYLNQRDLDKALSLYLDVDQLRRRIGAGEASDLMVMLGVVYRKKRNYDLAAVYLQQVLEYGEAQRNRSDVATAAHHLAWVRLNQGDLAQARRLCGRAIELYKEIGDTRGASDAYEQLGLIVMAEGRRQEALAHIERSLVIRRQLGNQHGAASCLRHLAVVHLQMGHLITAVRYLKQSLIMYWRLGVLSRQRFAAILRELLDWTVGRRRWTM